MRRDLFRHMSGVSTRDLYAALYIDEETGLYNRRAFDVMMPPQHEYVALVEFDSWDWRVSHAEYTDAVSKAFGRFSNAFRVRYDRAVLLDYDRERLVSGLERMRAVLDDFTYVVSSSLETAETLLTSETAKRVGCGLRAATGARPPWV